jgi:hypothetical protein
MRARAIKFTESVRTGPEARDWMPGLDVLDAHFAAGVKGEEGYRIGHIDVYLDAGPLGSRYVRLWSPRIDRQTGAPLEVLVPMERVVSWEPLSAELAASLYPGDADAKPARTEESFPQKVTLSRSIPRQL